VIDPSAGRIPRRVILGLMLAGLLVASYAVLHHFFVPLAWAGILVYVTWPAYVRLLQGLGGRDWLAALVMTLLLTAALVLPLLWLFATLRGEIVNAYAAASSWLASGPHRVPQALAQVPWLGEWLQRLLDQLAAETLDFRAQIESWTGVSGGDLLNLLGGLGRNAAKFGFALLIAYFLYRDGKSLVAQLRVVLHQFLGARVDHYFKAVGATTRAVVFGLVLTAIVQGALAGLGYWAAGLQAPVFLAAVTMLVALIPFGTPFVWGTAGVWLLAKGEIAAGVGLLAWGTLAVSWVDNLIRPFVISKATEIPFLIVMFGVLGGLAAFGMIGLFVGPVVLAVLIAVWREWLGDTREP
jgi:predicted PurR-regulated permease PerM